MVLSPSLVRGVSSLIRGDHDDRSGISRTNLASLSGQHCSNEAAAALAKVSVSFTPSHRILACSLSTSDVRLNQFQLATWDGRELCSDRRGFLSQLYPTVFAASTFKILFQQVSLIGMRFMTDQLELHMKKDDEVAAGTVSQEDADDECEEWSKREWRLRWTAFPERFMVGLVKFHAATLVMRLYETVASFYVDSFTLDRLTQDTFKSAKRAALIDSNPQLLRRDMFWTCLWANGIAYLADLSVQIVLLVGPAAYYYYRRRQERAERIRRLKKYDDTTAQKDAEDDVEDFGPLFMTLVYKSSLLTISRASSLVATSVGGAVGSAWYPGWGTLVGSNLADGVASGAFDELLSIQ